MDASNCRKSKTFGLFSIKTVSIFFFFYKENGKNNKIVVNKRRQKKKKKEREISTTEIRTQDI